MYHDVYEHDVNESGFKNTTAQKYKIRVSEFEKHVVTVKNCLESLVGNSIEVVFTFDDGGKSFLYVIAPILEKYGFRGVFFITTNLIDTPGFLSKEDITKLYQGGHIVGGHSHTHPVRMSAMSSAEILSEWRTSQEILSTILNTEITTASIPGGFCSRLVLRSMAQTGYKKLYTSNPTTNVSKLGECDVIGRYAIDDSISEKDVNRLIMSKSFRLKLRIRQGILGIAKKILGNIYLTIRKKLLK